MLWSPPLLENYYYGSHRYPYSTALSVNPMTFADIDPGQASAEQPRNPVLDWMMTPHLNAGGLEVFYSKPEENHNQGEIWCLALWQARANLVAKHGFSQGNDLILRLVTDGMKLAPPNPNFLQARDAILLADQVSNGGANLKELWEAFAKRGMGYGATSPSSVTTAGVVESFDPPPQGNVKWQFIAGDAIYSSPALGVDGTIYIGSDDGKLYALDPTDGSKKWEFTEASPPPQAFRSTPLVGPDGTIYARRGNGYLYAILPNGTLKWKTYVSYNAYVSPALDIDGTIYVAGSTTLYAISPQGTIVWSFPTGNTIYSSPAIGSDGTIYFGGMDTKLYAVDPVTHLDKPNWPVTLGDYVASSPALGADGSIYVGCADGKLYAFSPNGSPKWPAATLGGVVDSSPAIGPDGSVYVGSQNYGVYSINPNTGQINSGWPFVTGFYVRSSPAVAADGTVYVGSYDGKLYAITPGGVPKPGWTGYVPGGGFSSPALGADGTVYVGSGDKVYALSNLTGLARSSWPMFRQDPRHIANAGRIRFEFARRWPNGPFEFEILAHPSLGSVDLEASSDLVQWSVPSAVPLVNGVGSFLDAQAIGQSERFYRASSGPHRSVNPIGFMSLSVPPGLSMIANQLNTTNNTLNGLLPNVPDGTSLQKWNRTAGSYVIYNFFAGDGWFPNTTLNPGEGAFINSATNQSVLVTFGGEVLQGYLVNPIFPGTAIYSSMVPQTGELSSLLEYPPSDSDSVERPNCSLCGTFNYFDGVGWLPHEPQPAVGESFWIQTSTEKNWARSFSVWP